jgi:hypothetical protein
MEPKDVVEPSPQFITFLVRLSAEYGGVKGEKTTWQSQLALVRGVGLVTDVVN